MIIAVSISKDYIAPIFIGSSTVTVVKGQTVYLAWLGCESLPSDHPLAEEGDIFLSHEVEDMTQCASEPLDLVWLQYIISKCGKNKEILELFSRCGMLFAWVCFNLCRCAI